jgi:hypothetical protein
LRGKRTRGGIDVGRDGCNEANGSTRIHRVYTESWVRTRNKAGAVVDERQLSSSQVYRDCSFQTSNNVPASLNETEVAAGAAQTDPSPHFCPSKPPRLCKHDFFFFLQRCITSMPGPRAPVLFLRRLAAGGFMPSVADVHHFLIFEALAEIRYRPMSAPSVAQVAGNVQKRDSTKGHRS